MSGEVAGREDAEAWKVAVRVRPHYPPCDFPDHACGCGAAEDRPKIVQAFVQAVAEALAGVAHCPTPCDGDCDADCHEAHTPSWKRLHQPEHCPPRLLAAAPQPTDNPRSTS